MESLAAAYHFVYFGQCFDFGLAPAVQYFVHYRPRHQRWMDLGLGLGPWASLLKL